MQSDKDIFNGCKIKEVTQRNKKIARWHYLTWGYLHYWHARGVKISGWILLILFWWFEAPNIKPKLKTIWKTVIKHGFLMIFFSIVTFIQFCLYISARFICKIFFWIFDIPGTSQGASIVEKIYIPVKMTTVQSRNFCPDQTES